LRAIVADALGVNPGQLDPETSLGEDLAADSLDLLDVVVRIEDELDLVVPEREIAAIATYGDLVDAAVALLACRMRNEESELAPSTLEVRIGDDDGPRLVRVLGRDPYDRELLRDDLRAAGPRTVDVRSAGVPSESLERALVRARLAGADVRAPEQTAASDDCPDAPAVPTWPASRLVAASLTLIDDLREERAASLQRLVARTAVGAADLADRRRTTNDRVAAFRAVVETYLAVTDEARPILHAAARELGRLDLVRCGIDERVMQPDEVASAFDSIADALLCYVHALQSHEAWTRSHLPPRAMSRPTAAQPERQELRA
jgi:acyl carrier protein